MTTEEKELLIDLLEQADKTGTYEDLAYLEGLIHGLNLRRGEDKKISLLNGIALYYAGKEFFNCRGGERNE